MNITELSAQLIAESKTDPDFRQRLIETPRATISEFAKVEIPAGLEISILQETSSHRYLVLPPIAAESSELSDDDLARVSGGTNSNPDHDDDYPTAAK